MTEGTEGAGMTSWWVTETGAWVPAFAGMTEGAGMTSWWVTETGAWVPAFAGMTEGAGMTVLGLSWG